VARRFFTPADTVAADQMLEFMPEFATPRDRRNLLLPDELCISPDFKNADNCDVVSPLLAETLGKNGTQWQVTHGAITVSPHGADAVRRKLEQLTKRKADLLLGQADHPNQQSWAEIDSIDLELQHDFGKVPLWSKGFGAVNQYNPWWPDPPRSVWVADEKRKQEAEEARHKAALSTISASSDSEAAKKNMRECEKADNKRLKTEASDSVMKLVGLCLRLCVCAYACVRAHVRTHTKARTGPRSSCATLCIAVTIPSGRCRPAWPTSRRWSVASSMAVSN
jgi:hypothetical protein